MFKKNFVILILLTSTHLNAAVKSTSLKKSDKNPEKKTGKIQFDLGYSSDELVYGDKLSKVIIQLQKNELKSSDLNFLLTSPLADSTFSPFKKPLKHLEKLTQLTTHDDFFNNCVNTINESEENLTKIDEKIEKLIESYCRYSFLIKMNKYSPEINLSTRDYKYLASALPFYLKGESQNEFIQFVKNFKNNAIEAEKMTKLIVDVMSEHNLRPSTALLIQLKASPALSQFLSKNNSLSEKNQSVFMEEFQKIYKEAVEQIDQGLFAEAKKTTASAFQFYKKNHKFIPNKRAYFGLIIVAKNFVYKERSQDADEIFEWAREIAPKEEYSDSNYYLIWPSIIAKNDSNLKKRIEKYELEKNFDTFDSKLQYWIAENALKNKDHEKASRLFEKIIQNSPYSFYSIMALKELALHSKNKTTEKDLLSKIVSKSNSFELSEQKYSNVLKASLKRYAIWLKISNEKMQSVELKYIQSLSPGEITSDHSLAKSMSDSEKNEFLTLNLIKLLNEKKKFLTSIAVFQSAMDKNSLGLNYKLIGQLFPLNYFEVVKKNAHNLDPLIIISLIRQESAFNPEAHSSAGAKGLMQLMPTTAKRFNKRVKTKELNNPDVNVAIGVKYLKNLLQKFDGNLIFALASYNAGEGRIFKWKKDIFKTNEPLSIIEAIPYEETRNYVKLIYRNYFFYNLINNKSILMTPIEDSFKVSLSDF